jgi:hypothetical protein
VPVRLDKLGTEKGELVLEVSLDLAAPLRPGAGKLLRRGIGGKHDRERKKEED